MSSPPKGIRFDDVAGEDEAKENLAEIVDYLHDPQQVHGRSARPCRRAFCSSALREPARRCLPRPLRARQTCRSSPCPARSSSRCSSAWARARCATCSSRPRKRPPASSSSTRSTPSAKSATASIGGNDEREQTLNQLLTEMDGFEGNNGVIILAATNRPESLDPALTRPGRFDRRVPVELPDLAGPRGHPEGPRQKDQDCATTWTSTRSRAWPPALPARSWPTSSTKPRCAPCATAARVVTQADLEESIEVVIAGYQKKNAILYRPRKADRRLPRDRPRARGGDADALRARAEDHHRAAHLRRARATRCRSKRATTI